VRAQLGALRLPTLIVCGRHDRLVAPGSCTALRALIPGSDLVVLEQSGHEVAEADAATYRAAVQSLLIFQAHECRPQESSTKDPDVLLTPTGVFPPAA